MFCSEPSRGVPGLSYSSHRLITVVRAARRVGRDTVSRRALSPGTHSSEAAQMILQKASIWVDRVSWNVRGKSRLRDELTTLAVRSPVQHVGPMQHVRPTIVFRSLGRGRGDPLIRLYLKVSGFATGKYVSMSIRQADNVAPPTCQ